MPVKILTVEKLNEIIKSKRFEQLIGYAENSFFDAKKDFYNLRDPKDRHELCKDITAFANNDGGYLLIGCETDKSQTYQLEYVKAADGISDFPDPSTVCSILSVFVYPNTIGTFVDFQQITTENNKRFFLITISKNLKEKPYFVKRDSRDNEFAAYYIRTYDRGVRYHIEYLHELVHHGIYFEKYLKNIIGVTEKTLDNTGALLKDKRRAAIPSGTHYNFKKDL